MKELIDKFEWVEWKPKNLASVTPEEVERVEHESGFRIPLDYVEVAKHVQGKMPLPGGHDADGNGSALGTLYHFSDEFNSERLGKVDHINEDSEGMLLPFSQDGGGNIFAFNYGSDPNNEHPTVVFWDHETRVITELARSFTEFLGQLRE